MYGWGLRLGPKGVNASYSGKLNFVSACPQAFAPAVPQLGMLFYIQQFLSTNIPARIEPMLGPAARPTGEMLPWAWVQESGKTGGSGSPLEQLSQRRPPQSPGLLHRLCLAPAVGLADFPSLSLCFLSCDQRVV